MLETIAGLSWTLRRSASRIQCYVFVLLAALTCSLVINDVVKAALFRKTGAVA